MDKIHASPDLSLPLESLRAAAQAVKPRLQALEAEMPGPALWQQRHFAAAERIYFALWQALAPVYAAALQAEVLDWPGTIATQQAALHQWLEISPLRQAWRDYAAACAPGGGADADHRQVLEQRMRESAAPLREIPLYQGFMRVSCQQLVCLPEPVWQGLQQPGFPYAPAGVDVGTVERLALRVARVFNAPAWMASGGDADSAVREPVVWATSPAGLTAPMNSHGLRDRWEQDGRASTAAPPADAMVAPHWRYEGFYGLLRVALEDGATWRVAVLAPLHCVRRLAHPWQWD